jgi:hypothetical protein
LALYRPAAEDGTGEWKLKMGRRQLGRHRVLMNTQLRTGVDEIRLEVLDVLHELGVLRAQGLRIVLRVRKGSE